MGEMENIPAWFTYHIHLFLSHMAASYPHIFMPFQNNMSVLIFSPIFLLKIDNSTNGY